MMVLSLLSLIFMSLFYFSSFHTLIFLIVTEALVLSAIFMSTIIEYACFLSLMMMLISVCMGAFSVSMFVSSMRGKGSTMIMSFNS